MYKFSDCYKVEFDHVKNYNKFRPVKEMTKGQMPYFFQKIEVGEVEEEGKHFFTFDSNMFPLYIKIWCKDIRVVKESIE